MKNKSKIYGYYGGVATQRVYTPPASPSYVPQSPLVPLTQEEKASILAAAESVEFYAENAPHIMLRTSTVEGTVETFTITTSENPEDAIVYSAEQTDDGIDLNIMDGGFF